MRLRVPQSTQLSGALAAEQSVCVSTLFHMLGEDDAPLVGKICHTFVIDPADGSEHG